MFRVASAVLLSLALAGATVAQGGFQSRWAGEPDGMWLGPEVWANRLQDWGMRGGWVECLGTALPMRTLHLAPFRVDDAKGDLVVAVRCGRAAADGGALPESAFGGVIVGAGAADLDPRASWLVQSAPGPGGGFVCGVDGAGRLFVRDNLATDGRREATRQLNSDAASLVDVALEVRARVAGKFAKLEVAAKDAAGTDLGSVALDRIDPRELCGSIALVSHRGDGADDRARFRFTDWRAGGRMLARHDDLATGPIVAALHTLSRGTLKLAAVMMPVAGGGEVALEVRRGKDFVEVARAPFAAPDHTAVLRVSDWREAARTPFRVRFHGRVPGDRERDWFYEGAIRPEPTGPEVRLAALSCVHQVRHGLGKAGYPWTRDALWFPHADLTARLEQQHPDLLFFAGDQIYEGASPTPPSRGDDAPQDYLYKWYLFCLAFRDVARDRPTIVIPDDHDVYQGNLWGAGGRHTARDTDGGYTMSAEFVRLVERTQTSHLPDPVDPAPVEQGIGVYFTSLRYGGVDFAVLEDRKWKSGPAIVHHGGKRPDHVTDPAFAPATADVPGASLLGERQERFLDRWARDWDGVRMKAALSQTIFANVATHHGPERQLLVADLDSNGWPQSGRNRALGLLRKAFAPMIAGDQHLGSLVHHGIDAFRDAGWSFCVPSAANFYPRAWLPPQPGGNQDDGMPEYTGDYRDGLGNRITVQAVANPGVTGAHEPRALHDPSPGYGIVVFDTKARTIRFECWPRWADPAHDAQYPGWPHTVTQQDNYGRTAPLRLPKLAVEGAAEPVLVVEDGTGALIYAMRLAEPEFWPPVFAPGRYRVIVGDGITGSARVQMFDLEAGGDPDEVVRVRFQ